MYTYNEDNHIFGRIIYKIYTNETSPNRTPSLFLNYIRYMYRCRNPMRLHSYYFQSIHIYNTNFCYSLIRKLITVAPRCKPGTEQTSVGAINMHSIPVRCEVEADPPETIRFSWTYNNTRNVSPVSVCWIENYFTKCGF